MMDADEKVQQKNAKSPAMFAVGLTHPGKVREQNEDNFFIDNSRQLYIVADGVGGHQAGERASEVVVSVLPVQIVDALAQIEDGDDTAIINALDQSIRLLSHDLREFAGEARELRGMGATVVVSLVRNNKAYVSYMGDSRVYLMRGTKLVCLTIDHSIVGMMLSMGEITESQAKKHPMRHVITRHVGMDGEYGPDSLIVELKEGDVILLCSDGLTEMVSDKDIGWIIRGTDDINLICTRLIEAANNAGGKDNITVVVAQYGNRDTENLQDPGTIDIQRVVSYLDTLVAESQEKDESAGSEPEPEIEKIPE